MFQMAASIAIMLLSSPIAYTATVTKDLGMSLASVLITGCCIGLAHLGPQERTGVSQDQSQDHFTKVRFVNFDRAGFSNYNGFQP